jgi:hypothetical protein
VLLKFTRVFQKGGTFVKEVVVAKNTPADRVGTGWGSSVFCSFALASRLILSSDTSVGRHARGGRLVASLVDEL